MAESTDLIVVEELNPIEVYTPDGIKKVLETIKTKVMAHVPDVKTAIGRKNIASLAYKVARSKTLLDDMGAALVEKQKKEIKEKDVLRKEVRDTLDELKIKARQPLTDFEDAEEKRMVALAKQEETRVNSIRDRIEFIRNVPNQIALSTTAERILEILKDVTDYGVPEEVYQEFIEIAKAAYAETVIKIEQALSARVKFESEEAERKAESERLAKERAELDRIRAEEDAKRKDEEARLQVERDKLEDERRKIEDARREQEHREAVAKAEKEATERATREAKEKAEREAREKAEAETKAKAEAERQESLRPEKEKLRKYADSLITLPQPQGDFSLGAETILTEALKRVNSIYNYIIKASKEL